MKGDERIITLSSRLFLLEWTVWVNMWKVSSILVNEEVRMNDASCLPGCCLGTPSGSETFELEICVEYLGACRSGSCAKINGNQRLEVRNEVLHCARDRRAKLSGV